MEYRQNLLPPSPPQSDVETLCCGFIRHETPKDLAAQPVHTVIERLEKLQRALKMKSMGIWNHQREEERDAIRAKTDGDTEGARSHMRIALRLRQERNVMLKKYENMAALASRLQGAYENAAMAGIISSANVKLETLLTDDLEDLMDDLRDNLARVNEQDDVLAEDVGIPMDVDDELDALFIQKQDEDAAEMETRLPDAPKVKKENEEPRNKIKTKG